MVSSKSNGAMEAIRSLRRCGSTGSDAAGVSNVGGVLLVRCILLLSCWINSVIHSGREPAEECLHLSCGRLRPLKWLSFKKDWTVLRGGGYEYAVVRSRSR